MEYRALITFKNTNICPYIAPGHEFGGSHYLNASSFFMFTPSTKPPLSLLHRGFHSWGPQQRTSWTCVVTESVDQASSLGPEISWPTSRSAEKRDDACISMARAQVDVPIADPWFGRGGVEGRRGGEGGEQGERFLFPVRIRTWSFDGGAGRRSPCAHKYGTRNFDGHVHENLWTKAVQIF